MPTTEWKVTAGALTTVAVVSATFIGGIITAGPGPLPRITLDSAVARDVPAPSGTGDSQRVTPQPGSPTSGISVASVTSVATPGSPD